MIKSIQYLRFLAAFIVIFAHSNAQMYGISAKYTNMGGFGVDLFFVISGFIMPFIIFGGRYRGQAPEIGAAEFMARRVSRIWPMYFLATAAVVVLSWMVANGKFSDVGAEFAYHYNAYRVNLAWVFDSLTFTHGADAPVLGTGWTLQVEFMFYSAIAVILLSKPENLFQLEARLAALFALFFFISSIGVSASSFAKAYATPMIIEFAFGMIIYRLYSAEVLIEKKLAILLGIGAFIAFIFIEVTSLTQWGGHFNRPIMWGGCAFFIVWSALSLEKYISENKTLLLLGDSSYSLYLVHYIIGPVIFHYWHNYSLAESIPLWAYLSMFIVVCHLAGIACHLYLEKPINSTIRKIKIGRRASSPAIA